MSGRISRLFTLAAVAVALLASAACGDTGGAGESEAVVPEGPARSFMMGFSSLPRELNAASYADTIDFAGDNGDIVLIQRTVPWSDFFPGAELSDETANNTASERDAIDENDLALFFAIDPTDGASGRDRLVDLPLSHEGKRFDDPDVRAAFVSYAEYVAINYKPQYLALGVEMNLYYEKNREDFEHFKSLYSAAYDVVKEASPATQVTVTLQYEDLQALLPRDDTHFADWQLVRAFEPKLDVTAISTYPSFAFADAASIPENYYSQLRAFTDNPIVIAEMGFSSAPGLQGLNSGTEPAQADFVERVLADAGRLSMPAVVWFAIWDPAYARDTAFSAFQSIGLRRADDTGKPAWNSWAAAARRPYVP